jgi:serine/threonine-protein kinase
MAQSETQNDGLAAGSALGKYDIKRQLGRGGMGAVYEGVHRDLKKRVAIKVLMPQLAANEEAKVRFLREGEAASRINHPHVVDVTDVGTEGSITYLVMEFLEGEDLAHRLARGPLSLQEAADIMLPVLAGLGAAHDEGVIHRDLKPENIFLCRTRVGGVQPKVLDFGVSKLSGGTSALALTGTAATFGTPYYIPPEQLRGARQADKRSDQYSLGVVLYEAVCGRRPFEAENVYAMLRAIAEGEYPPPRSVFPDLPESMEQIIVKAMQLDPAQRFPTLRHFGAALLPFASDTARALWSSEFGSVGSLSSSSMPAGGTMVLSPEQAAAAMPPKPSGSGSITGRRGTGSVSGTKILPSSSPSSTTFGSATGQKFDAAPAEDLRPPSRRGLAFGIVALVVVAGGGGAYYFLKSPPPPPVPAHPTPQFFQVDVTIDPPSASVELDGQATGVGALQRRMEKDGQDHRLVLRAPGYDDAVVRFHDEPPPQMIRMIARPVPTKPTTPVVKPDDTSPTTSPTAQPPVAAGGHSAGGHHHHDHDHPPPPPTKPVPAAGGNTPPSHPTTPSSRPEAPNGAPIIE